MQEIKTTKRKKQEVPGFTLSKTTLQTDRPSEQSELPDPEQKPVLKFEKSLEAVDFTNKLN